MQDFKEEIFFKNLAFCLAMNNNSNNIKNSVQLYSSITINARLPVLRNRYVI